MQFLKILFWALLAFVAAIFTFGNWVTVSIRLFGGLVAEVNLPLLLLVTFLVGFVPTLIYQHWLRFRLRQRLAATERALEAERSVLASRTAPVETSPPPPLDPIPPVDPLAPPIVAAP